MSYIGLALNLNAQKKYAAAQPLFEKALEINRKRLTDEHPRTAQVLDGLALNLDAQGKYAQAQPMHERALETFRRLLDDDQPRTGRAYSGLAANLNAQGKYAEARELWRGAVRSLDRVRLRAAFTGLERAGGTRDPAHTALAAVQARLNRPAEAWQALEEHLGRGLLDELVARQGQRLSPAERAGLRELTAELERFDRLVETTPGGLDQAERARRFEDLKRQRELASIALGEFQTTLTRGRGASAGEPAGLGEIQAALPADAALVAWVDLAPAGPGAADPDGEHWGVVVRSRGIPAWVPIAGTGPDGRWTDDDGVLANRVRTGLRSRPDPARSILPSLLERLRASRLEPLEKALGATSENRLPARSLIVLPSRVMAGIPVEALLAPDDTRTVSYAALGHRLQVPAGAASPRSPGRVARAGRPRLRAARRVERAQAAARPRPAGQRGGARLERRGPRPEGGRRPAGVQRDGAEEERRLQGRGRWRRADRRRGLERRPVIPARPGPRRPRRRDRSAAGTRSDRRESRDEPGARGGAVG